MPDTPPRTAPTPASADDPAPAAERLGLCEWFHYGDHARVESAAATMRDLGVRHLRTGLSWADFHQPNGPAWMAFLFDTLADFEVLPSLWHTPPSISENGTCSGPPVRLDEFAEFTGYMIHLYGHRFGPWVELWNEPNGRYYWDFIHHDPLWHKFGAMIAAAAAEVKRHGRRALLGGLAPADPTFITLLGDRGNLDDVDGVSVHGFPEMWGDHHRDTSGGSERTTEWDEPWRWNGWAHRMAEFERVAGGREVWITETGYSTWAAPGVGVTIDERRQQQAEALRDVVNAPAARIYWYGLQDLHPDRASVDGFHADEHAYHFGLLDAAGRAKPAYHAFAEALAADAPAAPSTEPADAAGD